jgi:hypothetical protein
MKIGSTSPTVYFFDKSIIGETSISDDDFLIHCIDQTYIPTEFSEENYKIFLMRRRDLVYAMIAIEVGKQYSDLGKDY